MRFFFMGPRILGIRPGISFRPDELFGSIARKQNKPGEPMTGSFLYVIRGDHNMSKVGVTTNPTARLASLRTGSAFPMRQFRFRHRRLPFSSSGPSAAFCAASFTARPTW